MKNRNRCGTFAAIPLTWYRQGDCIICTSHKPRRDGYFDVCRNRLGKIKLHQLIAGRRHGKIPSGKVVRHTCDNPSCINPDHLIIGTQQDNIQDSVSRGRNAFGERNGHSKLTMEAVVEIRASNEKQRVLAKRFGVSQGVISVAKRGLTWRCVC